MPDQSDFIAQIQQKEKKAEKLIKTAEDENNRRVLAASEQSEQMMTEVEQAAKKIGQERLRGAKDKGKEEYKRILVEFDNRRRDVVETGKVNLNKAKKHVTDAFVAMFNK